jgi:NADH-quinone oxidoreductase subunit C
MIKEEKLNLLKSKLQDFEIKYGDTNGTELLIIKKEDIISVSRILKTEKELFYDLLIDIHCIDRFVKKNRFEINVNLWSSTNKNRIFLKIILDSKNPEMESLTQVWKSANWHERETYDMHGINFKNHPDLRRIYMPEEFEYFPLRKDFPLMGISGSIYLPKK